jgi:hypothetical protein
MPLQFIKNECDVQEGMHMHGWEGNEKVSVNENLREREREIYHNNISYQHSRGEIIPEGTQAHFSRRK